MHTCFHKLILQQDPGSSHSPKLPCMCPPHSCSHTALHSVRPPIVVYHMGARMFGGSSWGMCRPRFLVLAMSVGRVCPTTCPSQAFIVVVLLDFAWLAPAPPHCGARSCFAVVGFSATTALLPLPHLVGAHSHSRHLLALSSWKALVWFW